MKSKDDNAIVTLDGVFWDKSDILQQMLDDKFYFGYLNGNALSSSSCKKLLESPKVYEDSLLASNNVYSQPLRDGHLLHWNLLEPEKYETLVFKGLTKASKEYKLALEEHDVVYTETERHLAEECAAAFRSNSKAVELLQGARTEVPAIGYIEGIPFRAKGDILGGGYLADLKSTASVEKFKYSVDKFSYDMQMFIYCELFGISYKDFYFIAIDKSTKLIGIFECSKELYHRGENKTMDAIQIFKDFFIDKKRDPSEFYLYDVL